MLRYTFSSMAAAQKAKDALKTFGFNRVSLDANDRLNTDAEFSTDYGFGTAFLSAPTTGSSNNYYLVRDSASAINPFVLDLTSEDHRAFKTVLIVDEGESDPQLVDKIVSKYIGLS